jgi:hypothetical protein
MFDVSRRFALDHGDAHFEARLAFGLLRSFTTSTRFQFDQQFSELMFNRGLDLLHRLVEYKKHLHEFKLEEDVFLYGSM